MIEFTGRGDQTKLTLIVMGDGETTSMVINLGLPPFNLKFVTGPPIRMAWFASVPNIPSSGPPGETYTSSPDTQTLIQSVEYVAPNLQIVFNHPPPTANPIGVPRSRLDLYFIYGSSPITTR